MKAKKKLLIGTLAAALVASGAGAVSTMAWYKANGAGVTISTNTNTVSTAAETVGSISLAASWTAKKADNSTDFDLASDTLSFVDLADGTTYVYNGTVDSSHKQTVASRGGEQFINVKVNLSGSGITSAQYGTYTVTVSAGAEDSTNKDILYIYKNAATATSTLTWGSSNFDKSKDLSTSVTINAASFNQDFTFVLVAKGLDQDQSSEYNNGTLTVTMTLN